MGNLNSEKPSDADLDEAPVTPIRGVFGTVTAPEGRPRRALLSGGYEALKRGEGWELNGRCGCEAGNWLESP